MTELEVRGQKFLSFAVDLGLGIFGNGGRVKEVEKAVVLHGFGHGADGALRLVLLLLLDSLDGHVLAGLPVDGATLAFVDLGSFEAEGFVAVRSALHLVLLGQLGVGEEVVG